MNRGYHPIEAIPVSDSLCVTEDALTPSVRRAQLSCSVASCFLPAVVSV